MFRDPFGDWDYDAIREFMMGLGLIAVVLTLGGLAEGDWALPWKVIGGILSDNLSQFLLLLSVGLIGLWQYEQIRGGS
tara:strand:+ start:2724 stop:2957 length:234 start_codon:yes stop_codon:yes gene_type:complete